MRVDMGREAITRRLKAVNELRRTCLSLANSSAGKEILRKLPAHRVVLRTSRALGRRHGRR